jgi:CRISPR-associated endoribonuclease Cas6
MDMTPASTGPARLYAMLLRLRPIQSGTLMPFSGKLAQGAFLAWLHATAPDVATWLHDGSKRRLFTCSSLHFSHSLQPSLKAERENIHLPLDPQMAYPLRLTLLLGDLFPLFYNALTQFSLPQTGSATPPFVRLGKQIFLLEEVLLANDDPSGWTGFTSLTSLVEKAKQMTFGRAASLTLEFGSLTTFCRGNNRTGYGMQHVMLPLPQLVFQSLLKRWQDIAPPELIDLIQTEHLEEYLQKDGVIIIDYTLTAHHVHFSTHQQPGFVGTCTYQLRGLNDKATTTTALTLQQQIYLLAQLAFYSGIGYKTAMGLGQARLRE